MYKELVESGGTRRFQERKRVNRPAFYTIRFRLRYREKDEITSKILYRFEEGSDK